MKMEETDPTLHNSNIPSPPQATRESLLRRVTPHFLPTLHSNHEPGAQQTENGRNASRPRLDEFIRHLSHHHDAQANEDFPEDKLVTNDHKLADFRRLVGIDSSKSHTLTGGYHRAAENIGIYRHVVEEEKACMTKYKRFSILINASLGLQLIFAAALTALGAGEGPHSAVTAFGAINTVGLSMDLSSVLTSQVLAGILTFLKGSGLPNREKYYASEWKKVRDHIEQREREFGRSNCMLDVDSEMRNIEAMYHEVKQDVEANTPDGFTSVAAKRLVGNMGPQNTASVQSTLPPRALEAGYGQAPYASPPISQQHLSTQTTLNRLSSQVDPSSKAGKIIGQLSSLQAKYGDTILEKLGHLDKHETIDKAGEQLSQSHRNLEHTLDRTVASGQHIAQQQVEATSHLIGSEAEHLASAAVHAQSVGEAASRDLAERTAAAGRDTLHNAQAQAGRVTDTIQGEAGRLVQVGRQAETAARNISAGIASELKGFLKKDDHHQ